MCFRWPIFFWFLFCSCFVWFEFSPAQPFVAFAPTAWRQVQCARQDDVHNRACLACGCVCAGIQFWMDVMWQCEQSSFARFLTRILSPPFVNSFSLSPSFCRPTTQTSRACSSWACLPLPRPMCLWCCAAPRASSRRSRYKEVVGRWLGEGRDMEIRIC